MSLTRSGLRTERWAVQFDLSGSATRGSLLLEGPLGTRIAQANWTPDGAWLTRNGQTEPFADMAQLTEAALGQALPLAALFAWIQGNAVHAAPWVVDLTQWATGRIRASQTAANEKVDVLLVLDAAP